MGYRVLTVNREFGSGGGRIAQTIANWLGWKLLDRDIIDAIAYAAHVDKKVVRTYDEHVVSWLRRINQQAMRSAALAAGLELGENAVFDAEEMVKISEKIIEKAHADGNCVIVGRGSQCVLQHRPDVFHVFVYAPLKERILRLRQRLEKAYSVTLHPLRLEAVTVDGIKHVGSAINEISILRETQQAVKLRILIDGTERIAKFSGDGILVASPAGSTAYNHSCGGPIIPLDANIFVMTAISGYRPRGWSYAVLPQSAVVEIEVLETGKRPVRIEAGTSVITNVAKIKIWLDRAKNTNLLFDPDQHLGERIIRAQFML